MKKEKMLIETEEKNILKKIFNFIKKIFSKNIEKKINEVEEYKKENNLITQLGKEREILNMQKRLENGEIKEADLTEEEKNSLIKLYNEQIDTLKQEEENYNRILKSYKEKILIARSKIKN